MKKLLSVMLSFAMIIPMCMASGFVSAEEAPSGQKVSTVEEFLDMAPNGVYYLANDIDFSGREYERVMYGKAFTGVLDGNGHSITGITVKGTESDASIFANQFGGTIKNLTVGSEDAPVSVSSTGSPYSVAAMAGTVVSGATFENIRIYGNIKGDGKTAGFTSYMPNGNLTIKNCKVYGSVSGNPASGFVCMSNGGSSQIAIYDSENHANITGKNLSAGGFYAIEANVTGSRSGSLTLEGCTNYGGITASDWRVGGLVGEFHENKGSTLKISYCYNMGPVTMTGGGGFAAGIVGGMCFDAPDGSRSIENVYNAGIIRNTANSGNAYAIAFAHSSSDKNTVKNACYTDGKVSENCVTENVVQAPSAQAVYEAVSKYAPDASGRKFIADTGDINSSYPILSTQMSNHTNVHTYECGRKVCLDCETLLTSPEAENHSYNKTSVAPALYTDGYVKSVCRYCSDTVLAFDKASDNRPDMSDGAYLITKAEHLMWYASNLSAGLLKGNENLVLCNDIDMKGFELSPIDAGNKGFRGSLDGQLHTVSNLKIEGAGLFTRLGLGSSVKDIGFINAQIKADKDAGVLAGNISAGAVVRIEGVSVINSEIESRDGAAGSIIGSTDGAVDTSFISCVCDGVKVTGKVAGSIAGVGNSCVMKNVFASATLSASSGSTGTLATHSSSFSAENCGYGKLTVASQRDGKAYDTKSFESGEIAYILNTFGANKRFGITDGRTSVSESPASVVRIGGKQYYTTNVLGSDADTEAYFLSNGKLVIVHKQTAKDRLVDAKITVAGKDVKFNDFTLSRYAECEGEYYVARNGCVLYVMDIVGTEAPALSVNGVTCNVISAE